MPKINPKDISVDATGKVTILNKKLALDLKKVLDGKKGIKLKPGGTGAFIDVNFGC